MVLLSSFRALAFYCCYYFTTTDAAVVVIMIIVWWCWSIRLLFYSSTLFRSCRELNVCWCFFHHNISFSFFVIFFRLTIKWLMISALIFLDLQLNVIFLKGFFFLIFCGLGRSKLLLVLNGFFLSLQRACTEFRQYLTLVWVEFFFNKRSLIFSCEKHLNKLEMKSLVSFLTVLLLP